MWLLKGVVKPSVVEEEGDPNSLTEAIEESKEEISSFVNSLPVPLLVVQDSIGGDVILHLEPWENIWKISSSSCKPRC